MSKRQFDVSLDQETYFPNSKTSFYTSVIQKKKLDILRNFAFETNLIPYSSPILYLLWMPIWT